ncbi:penicillin acylase family protein [Verminephrobacter aporrectodeae subsp. tuberculatae]|uniref:penicillin acylase family protein n=1 Tax=Verminephrobacter aporrectodeae TaxID=1110389 RepID=UPI0022370DB4|nr:penicillin acylase family protein [Verminephrobacter aporrectodeae]MCW5254896.1 penicillin acylase family protein [Verminephrobacter aporrectodeae subsp. tuberculatae]
MPLAHAAGTTETLRVPGLQQKAEILIDEWGVPHIYAASQTDAFFVQGFNAARDRLFQIDLWRRRGLGQLAQVFGPAYVAQDQATRLFLYRGDMQREWNAYGKQAEKVATAFVAGINAYVDFVTAHPERLPYEFKQLAYLPAKWQAQDVVRIRSHGLTRNLNSEVARAHVVCKANLESDTVRLGLKPKWEATLPEGLDPCLPEDLLKVFQLATQNVRITPGSLAARADDQGDSIRIAADENLEETMEGSNNWVVAPAKSATGRAIMANDPHRAYSAPSLRYIAHLIAPGLNVIGAGEPALPGISIGHNGSIAFGLTIFSIDQEDLYVYELNPDNPDEYKYQGQWERLRVLHEPIEVKGAAPVTAQLRFTRHGPVIFVEKEKNRAFALRSGWMEPGMSPYFGSIEYMRAKNYKSFKRAMLHWGAPTENLVYADTKGNIGWVPGGLAPKRPNWDGLLPVPGDGRYEWAGFWSGDQLPSSYNPKQGWFASANQMNLPDGYPYQQRKLGFEWTNGSRFARISEVLAALPKVSLQDSMDLQNDDLSIPARRLTALLDPLSSTDARTQAALNVLKGWDCVERVDSAPAALYEVWLTRHLGTAFKRAVLSQDAAAAMGPPDVAVLLDTLEQPQARLGEQAAHQRDAILLGSLGRAYAEMLTLQGEDPVQWQWGRLHYNLMEHPLASAVDEATRAKLNVGPLPKHGGPYSPNQSMYRPGGDFRQTNGPSFRVVVDVGNWDNSRTVNAPGQSGDPESPHYRDLAEKWLHGDYFPLLYSRKAVEQATLQKIVLEPGKRAAVSRLGSDACARDDALCHLALRQDRMRPAHPTDAMP